MTAETRLASTPTGRIVVGLLAGAAVGLFVGERAQILQVVADGFVKLLQMAVLPYVTVSIIGRIGGLRMEDVRTVGMRVALVLLALWVPALCFAFLMALTFPPMQTGSFFSTTLLEPAPPFNIVDLYIPANPFFALANNVVPAVVLFSMIVGIALIGLPQKQILLDVLETAGDTLARAMRFVVRLTPYGIFAIAATTAGTIRFEQVVGLQIYLIAYAALALLLGLWVLPGLVAALTPIPMREIFSSTREALLTATVAGDLFIVLPVIVTACKQLLATHASGSSHSQALPDVIVPTSFNFPHSGKLLSLSFVLFAGWFSDAAIALTDYPSLGVSGIVTLFGSVTSAMPFLLDLFRVPADTFQLFVASGVVNSRFGTLVAASHTVAITLIGTCAVIGAIRWRPRAIARYLALTLALTAGVIVGARLLADRIVAGSHTAGDRLDAMRLDTPADAIVVTDVRPAAATPPQGDRLHAIASRRAVRVGYLSDALPFVFFNARHELVGLDVALMHQLASELGVRLEFVPILRAALDQPSGAADLLRAGYCDVVIGGIAVTTTRAGLLQLSSSYLDETMGFVVLDRDRSRFSSWDAIRAAGPLTIAVPNLPYYVEKLRTRLPQAHLRTAETIEALFDHAAAATGAGNAAGAADALALPAERGSAWTLRYPQYSAVVPLPGPIKIPLAFALPRGEPDFAAFVNTWIDLKRRDGTIDDLFRVWILGQSLTPPRPRWSIMQDLLHWQ